MKRLARDIIASLRDEPHRWSSNDNLWKRDDGYEIWRGSGAAYVDLFRPVRADIGGYFTKRAVWRAFKEWEADMPLGGYQA